MFEFVKSPQQRAFLSAYSECGIVKRAAQIANVSREAHYDWKAKDADYAEAFAFAQELAGDALEGEAIRRAQLGITDYVLYQGSIVKVDNGRKDADGKPILKPLRKRKYSDSLLATVLAGFKRAKYGKLVEHTGEVNHTHKHAVDLSQLSDNELEALGSLLSKTRLENHAGSDRGGTPAAPAE